MSEQDREVIRNANYIYSRAQGLMTGIAQLAYDQTAPNGYASAFWQTLARYQLACTANNEPQMIIEGREVIKSYNAYNRSVGGFDG